MREYKYFTREEWAAEIPKYLDEAETVIAEIKKDFHGRTLTYLDVPKHNRLKKMENQRDFCLEELERLAHAE